MKTNKLQFLAAAAACMGMLASPVAMAAPPAEGAVADVALADGGVLLGQLVDAQGLPLAGRAVSIQSGGQEVARVATNQRGVFTAPNMKGGVYQVSAEGHQGVYRLWAPRTAPPAANRGIMAVAGDSAVRAQNAPCPQQPGMFARGMNWVSQHPFITAGIVATAIAVPLALDDDDDPAS